MCQTERPQLEGIPDNVPEHQNGDEGVPSHPITKWEDGDWTWWCTECPSEGYTPIRQKRCRYCNEKRPNKPEIRSRLRGDDSWLKDVESTVSKNKPPLSPQDHKSGLSWIGACGGDDVEDKSNYVGRTK